MPKGRTQLANGWWAEDDGGNGVDLYLARDNGWPTVCFNTAAADGCFPNTEAAWAAARAFAAISFAQDAVLHAKLGWPHTWEGRGGAHPPGSTARKIVDSLRDFDRACCPRPEPKDTSNYREAKRCDNCKWFDLTGPNGCEHPDCTDLKEDPDAICDHWASVTTHKENAE